MRKRLVSRIGPNRSEADHPWLDLEKLVQVEVTSEDLSHPIEFALLPSSSDGWRAAEPGEQCIRLIFDDPQKISRILLVFEETTVARSQEFALRWSSSAKGKYREIVRQQFNFSPPGTVVEREDYHVELPNVSILELQIFPDKGNNALIAALAQLRLA
jgi:hypothetical protein